MRATLKDRTGTARAWPTDGTIAAKLAPPDAADVYEADEALLYEARLLAALKHRGIIELIGVVAATAPPPPGYYRRGGPYRQVGGVGWVGCSGWVWK